jgi:hypothetical protein
MYCAARVYRLGRVGITGKRTSAGSGSGSDFSIHEDENPTVTEDIEEQQPPPVSMIRILQKNMPEWPFILIGSIGSIVMGFAMPIFGVLFGDILGVSNLNENTSYNCNWIEICSHQLLSVLFEFHY